MSTGTFFQVWLAIFAIFLAWAVGVEKLNESIDQAGLHQQFFPCQEDEGLMYDPQFGPDRVGCIDVGDIPNWESTQPEPVWGEEGGGQLP